MALVGAHKVTHRVEMTTSVRSVVLDVLSSTGIYMVPTLHLLSYTETPEGLAVEYPVSVLVPRSNSQSSWEEAPTESEGKAVSVAAGRTFWKCHEDTSMEYWPGSGTQWEKEALGLKGVGPYTEALELATERSGVTLRRSRGKGGPGWNGGEPEGGWDR